MISVTFFTNTPLFPAKLVAGYATGIGFILLMIFRSAANIVRLKLLKRGLGARRVILIGNCDLTHVLADFIELIRWLALRLAELLRKPSSFLLN